MWLVLQTINKIWIYLLPINNNTFSCFNLINLKVYDFMPNSYTYKEEEFVCTELFIDSGPVCSGCSSPDVTTKGTSRL